MILDSGVPFRDRTKIVAIPTISHIRALSIPIVSEPKTLGEKLRIHRTEFHCICNSEGEDYGSENSRHVADVAREEVSRARRAAI